jgi:hypothetical protein
VFSLVVPFHSDVDRLAVTLSQADEARRHGIGEVLYCHNGVALPENVSRDLAAKLRPDARLLHTPVKGIGAGYRLGIEAAREEFVVLSASDLPFGFSDVDAFMLRQPLRVAIGSKAHLQSRIPGYPWSRRAATVLFYLFRRLLLGPGTPRDSQGTIIAETALAQQIVKNVRADDYFFSLEFLTLCARMGIAPVELPVTLARHEGASSVRLWHDSVALAKQTWRLRRRLQ